MARAVVRPSLGLSWALLTLVACAGSPDTKDATTDTDTDPVAAPPLGLDPADGVTLAGAAVVDITPDLAAKDSWDDLNGDENFQGNYTDATQGDETWTDVNGNGFFDPVFIGGFGPERPATSVREGDPITTRAMVMAHGDDVLAIVSLDLVGLTHVRIDAATERLAELGFPAERLLVTTTHNHQGPDALGLWGSPLLGISGVDPLYQERLVDSIVDSVQAAAAAAEPASLSVGAVDLRDQSVWFNGAAFDGKNPTSKMFGLIHDIRDPVIVSDQVLVLQARATAQPERAVFTFTSHSAHPETRGSDNHSLATDFVGVMRDVIEDRYGGVVVHVPESLGGMQSALGGDVPLVDEDGVWVYQTCDAAQVADAGDADCFGQEEGSQRVDADGDAVPVWAQRSSWEIVRSQGWHVGQAAIAAVEASEPLVPEPFRVEEASGYVPVRNAGYTLLGPSGIFDIALDEAVQDASICPGAPDTELGCLPFRTSRVQIGTLGLVTAPGELFPELAWGMPEDDPVWLAETADLVARGPDSRYFPQHDEDCDTVDPLLCLDQLNDEGDCKCTSMHAAPYSLSEDPSFVPVLDRFGPEVTYRAAMSSTHQYVSYIVPRPDFHTKISFFTLDQGDHYEESVSPAFDFAPLWLAAQAEIDARW